MFVGNIVDLKQRSLSGRLLGIDYGGKRIGLALSDLGWKIAAPLMRLDRQSLLIDRRALVSIVEQHQVAGVVIGLPLLMSGQEGQSAHLVRKWAGKVLYGELDQLPVGFYDERLSTRVVERVLKESKLARPRREQLIDKMAATYLLQGALDALSSLNN